MKRTILLGLTLGIAACGGSGKAGTGTTGGGGGTTGGCPTSLCGGVCCAAGDSCIGNACCAAALSCNGFCCPTEDSCVGNACCPASQACGSVCCAGPETDGGGAECVNNACCPTARACRDICCNPGSECSTDQNGLSSCFVTCEKSADCNPSTPCCEVVKTGLGGFSGHGICTGTPSNNAYQCLCAVTFECSILGDYECVPDVDGKEAISGPYVCSPNDSKGHDGCKGGSPCSGMDLYCATDSQGDQFCSAPCNGDALCNDPGVACCNTTCAETEYTGSKCCGLCGS